MKVVAFFVALVLSSPSSLEGFGRTVSSSIDDPPPEPVTCPLCGGDPILHVVRTFAIVDKGVDLAVSVLRW